MIIEAHCHPFGPPSHRDLSDKIWTVADLVGFRQKYPELYNAWRTEPPVDFVDDLIAEMDRYGIEKALIMGTDTSEDADTTNERTATALKKYPDRLFGLMQLGTEGSEIEDLKDFGQERKDAPKQIAHWIGEMGFRGVQESHGGPFTTEIHPVKIAEDLRPIMETLASYKAPIMFATGWTQFPGKMYYSDPIYVDEIAGRYPDVPIILAKMGRGIPHYFESAMIVAMRNSNVYFDTSYTTPEHLNRAVRTIGADRIMFGSDWALGWRWVRNHLDIFPRAGRNGVIIDQFPEPEELYAARLRTVRESGISDAEIEQILGKTAAQVFGI